MTVFSLLCGCFRRPTDHPPRDHPHEHRRPRESDPDPTQHGPPMGSDSQTSPESVDAGYAAITPLPAYTPHPVDVREKTLEAHLRDPPLSSESYPHHTADPDAKSSFHNHYYYYYNPHFHPHNSKNNYNNNNNNEDLTSDVSSAISFTSSYGNTSTATRETPPPPYSPRGVSPSPSWRRYRQQWANTAANPVLSSSATASTASSRRHSRSMSVSSASSLPYPAVPPPAPTPPVPPLPMAQVTPPRPVLRRGVGVGRRSVDETRRCSWESR